MGWHTVPYRTILYIISKNLIYKKLYRYRIKNFDLPKFLYIKIAYRVTVPKIRYIISYRFFDKISFHNENFIYTFMLKIRYTILYWVFFSYFDFICNQNVHVYLEDLKWAILFLFFFLGCLIVYYGVTDNISNTSVSYYLPLFRAQILLIMKYFRKLYSKNIKKYPKSMVT